jgi:TATA-box binding protein (TBP) (component of TFIID and TFIIIB)
MQRLLTRALAGTGCGEITYNATRCLNIVTVVFLPFHVDIEQLTTRMASFINRPERGVAKKNKSMFEGAIAKHPSLGKKRKLLIYRRGTVVCVGSNSHEEIKAAYDKLLPFVFPFRERHDK